MYNPVRSASSWGCELKYEKSFRSIENHSQPPREAVSWNKKKDWKGLGKISQPPREAVSWNIHMLARNYFDFVSLLVRLWVEINVIYGLAQFVPSASSWGCELKCPTCGQNLPEDRQPPREAVSWNVNSITKFLTGSTVSLLVRLWVEIMIFPIIFTELPRQPPREAVSWNELVLFGTVPKPASASSWGCELKFWLHSDTETWK